MAITARVYVLVARRFGCTQTQIALVSALCALIAGVDSGQALADQSWQSLKLQGERLSAVKKYGSAAEMYEKALQKLPQDRENEKVDLQITLASAYNRQFEIDKAVQLLNEAANSMRILKAQNRLDPQILVSFKYMLESSDHGYSSAFPYDQRVKATMRMAKITNAMCDEFYPQGNTYFRQLGFARTFIANRDLPGAEKQLQSMLKKLSPNSFPFKQCQWCLAGVQQRLGKAQQLDNLARIDGKTHSPAYVFGEIANAHLWAADYQGCRQNLDKALELLKRKPDREVSDYVYSVYVIMYEDNDDRKGAEPWIRKQLALYAPEDAKYQIYTQALATNLRRQHRFAEADAVLPKHKKSRAGALTEWEWFLTDQEKADVEKADARERRSGSFKAKHANLRELNK